MSCGRHHETDCREVLDRLYEFLDSEVTPGDLHRIREHLDECAPCLQEYDIEHHVKALVRRSCHETAPPELRSRIMLRIEQVRLQMDG